MKDEINKNITEIYQTTLLTPTEASSIQETVMVEQPVDVTLNEIRVGTALVMPQDLKEFAVGFLFGQGYITQTEQVVEVTVCQEGLVNVYAKVDDPDLEQGKDFVLTSGCGGTGKIEREGLEGYFPALSEFRIDFPSLRELILGTLNISKLQRTTHCVHGCGYRTQSGVQIVYEDVGRHNAVDKMIGAIILQGLDTRGAVYTTGRLTSDMVLKCARMSIPIVVSRTAASTLGVEIAKRAGLTLIGYARPERLNIFNAPERIIQHPE